MTLNVFVRIAQSYEVQFVVAYELSFQDSM